MPPAVQGGVVAIGNFDGVHLGHQRVLSEAVNIALQSNVPALAMTFEPHPRTVFRPDHPVFRLTDVVMKARVLEAMGLDGMIVCPFDRDFAATEAEDFVSEILQVQLNAGHVVTGFNFQFGKNRRGTPEFLKSSGANNSFGVSIVERLAGQASDESEDDTISSSRIRRLLGDGDVNRAGQLLGYRWLVSGTVQHGRKMGRDLGFPTANLTLAPEARLAHGVYAVRLRRASGELFDGVASYGRRPTFDDGAPLLETFIFDFDGDLYGEEVTVSLFDWIRGEEKFESVDELIAAMNKDTDLARDFMTSAPPLSALDARLNFQN